MFSFQGPLVRWIKVNFSEAFTAWIHVKALRVFVESVLRYGLPVNFQAVLMHPNKKSMKRLREVLNQMYAHLDSSGSSNPKNADVSQSGQGQTPIDNLILNFLLNSPWTCQE
jgi:V-type H+-transporting ATPase subunit C